jgi:hypothetical protein
VAVASQKFTCPVVTFVEPEVTVAVRVTTLPDATVVTVLPPELIARVVVVAAPAAALPAQACDAPAKKEHMRTKKTDRRSNTLALTDKVKPLLRQKEATYSFSGEEKEYHSLEENQVGWIMNFFALETNQ